MNKDKISLMILSFNNSYSKKYNTYKTTLERLTNKTFKMLKIKNNYVIELNFVDNKTIKKINKTYRKIDKVTDVISFAFLELDKNEIPIKSKEPQFLGEIDISIDKIISQAKEYKHSFKYELVYLYIHGLLHLLGYDHVKNKKDAIIMFQTEEKILENEKL